MRCGVAAGSLADSAWFHCRWGRSRRSRHIRAPYCRSSARSASAQMVEARAIRIRRTCRPRLSARSICVDGQNQDRSRSCLQAACRSSRKPITSGISMETGWPSIAASASMPPTPQPSTAEPVDHGGMAVRADQRVRIDVRCCDPCWSTVHATLREILDIDLMADAGAGRHHAEIVERAADPISENLHSARHCVHIRAPDIVFSNASERCRS